VTAQVIRKLEETKSSLKELKEALSRVTASPVSVDSSLFVISFAAGILGFTGKIPATPP
jgi:hypothetical protein